MDLNEIDDEYEERMTKFESNCADGTGNPVACHQVGEYLSVVKNDYVKAARVFKKNCESLEHAPSCFNLARLFLGGKGVEQSDAEAVKNFEKACDGDHQPACYHAGYMLLHGAESVKQNTHKAMNALDSSCNGGLADGCHLLAVQMIRKDGKGPTSRDPARARNLLERGCGLNHGPCCFNLAVMYKNGDDGVPSDQEKYSQFKQRTEELVSQYGSVGGMKAKVG